MRAGYRVEHERDADEDPATVPAFRHVDAPSEKPKGGARAGKPNEGERRAGRSGERMRDYVFNEGRCLMNLVKFLVTVGLVGVSWSSAAWSAPDDDPPAPATQPPPQEQPPLPSLTPAQPKPDVTAPAPPPAASNQPAPSNAAGTSPTAIQPSSTNSLAPEPAPLPAPLNPPAPMATPAPQPVATPAPAPQPSYTPTPEPSSPPAPYAATPQPGPAHAAAPQPARPPQDVRFDSSTADSQAYTTSAANAQMEGNPQAALGYATRAIAADPRDPWAHYNKAMALARLGNVDDALKSFASAEGLFNVADVWGRSVAIYGRAHALSVAGRCEEAKGEFLRYAAFVHERDPRSADMAVRYAAGCREHAGAEPATPTPPTPAPTTP
jgi:hypothetical protein